MKRVNPSLFSSQEYALYRFEYPEILFDPLRSSLSPVIRNHSPTVLDLGCGTGLVTESFLKSYSAPVEIHLVDPDEAMLRQARKQLALRSNVKTIQLAAAEKLPFPDHSFDLVLIGSAWHWMNQNRAMEEIERILKPQGLIFIFEYQFPKSLSETALNDWIRLQFNIHWKPSTQTPRGSLMELTQNWRLHPQFSQRDAKVTVQERFHGALELSGVIVSQSRYQHYERSFTSRERLVLREQLEQKLDEFLKGRTAKFSYLYQGYSFRKRI